MDDDASISSQPTIPPGRTILIVSLVLVVLLIAIGVWLAYRMNISPVNECAYSGGVWSEDSDSCIFEGGARGGSEAQSGHMLPSVAVIVPDTDIKVTFEDVEVGGSGKTYSQEFIAPDGEAKGIVYLLQELSRVHKGSGDLVMPFVVGYGGTGSIYFLGVFKKEGDAVTLSSAQFVGDRVGVDSLSLGTSEAENAYTVRLLYRDRMDGEPMSAIPREQRSLEATIFDHRVDTAFVTSRDGLLYKDLLKVSLPKLRSEITSPLRIEGEARGNWYFEASFPITLVDWDGRIIAEGHAEAQEDWMTEAYVPYKATLDFTVPEDVPYRRGTLILRKDNPSGLPEHDDAFEIPIIYK